MKRCLSISKLPSLFGLITCLEDLYMGLDTKGHTLAIGQLNALKILVMKQCFDHEAISMLNSLDMLNNLDIIKIYTNF